MGVRLLRAGCERRVRHTMWERTLHLLAAGVVALALAPLIDAAAAQEAGWKTFTRAELGLTIQGPKDHGWSVIITSQKLKPGQTLASVVEDEKKRNPKAEMAPVKIGDPQAGG